MVADRGHFCFSQVTDFYCCIVNFRCGMWVVVISSTAVVEATRSFSIVRIRFHVAFLFELLFYCLKCCVNKVVFGCGRSSVLLPLVIPCFVIIYTIKLYFILSFTTLKSHKIPFPALLTNKSQFHNKLLPSLY